MFKFKRFALYDEIEVPVTTEVVGLESGPLLSITIRTDRFDGDVLAALDRLVEFAREDYDYNPMDSIY